MSHHSNMTTSFIVMLAAAVLPLAGCGGGDSRSGSSGSRSSSSVSTSSDSSSSGPTTAGSCNNAASGFCVEYVGSDYKAMKTQKACEAQKLTFLAGACPTEGRVGSCLVNKGKTSESYYRYYTGFPGFGVKPKGGVAAAAESQCGRLKGEWIAN